MAPKAIAPAHPIPGNIACATAATAAVVANTSPVPADWVVRRPESMTAFDAMTMGTAGFTAAHLRDGTEFDPVGARCIGDRVLTVRLPKRENVVVGTAG